MESLYFVGKPGNESRIWSLFYFLLIDGGERIILFLNNISYYYYQICTSFSWYLSIKQTVESNKATLLITKSFSIFHGAKNGKTKTMEK